MEQVLEITLTAPEGQETFNPLTNERNIMVTTLEIPEDEIPEFVDAVKNITEDSEPPKTAEPEKEPEEENT